MRRTLLSATLVLGALAACESSDPSPVVAPLPDGVVLHLDQSRTERMGREVFIRVENGTRQRLAVEELSLTSPRLPTTTRTGDETVEPGYEGDLELDLPTGRCGTAIDASVTLRYRLGDGPVTTSTAPADDAYGSVALLADRDCAASTLTAAADVSVGAPRVVGRDRASVLRLPVTLTPTGRTTGTRFAGFESTVLFRQTAASPADVSVPLDAGSPVTTQVLSVVPSRCDPHALAEDKVGTLFGVRVQGTELGDDAAYYLPLTREQRSAFFDFFATHCGLSRP
ncbi:hypothetical protein [Aeromicrobium sp. Root472D3]|uniref:hypothetical protein n=1 Tax=Aeromicrobium sp. Root472D3 TaxID=1736540 RepID=UPI0006FC8C37|nr:hypothetical protein [Aeromicrobium sp. Root472D3]KQX75720.1 hypothetical protein ASD10_11355 [Aeromicrobium sp. Root472D3]